MDYTDQNGAYKKDKRNGFKIFIIGLIIGLFFAGVLYLIHKIMESNSISNTMYTGQIDSEKGKALIQASSDGTFYSTLTDYSSMLIESTREGVDTPSSEGTQSAAALDAVSNRLISTLGNDTSLRSHITALNTAVATYGVADNRDTSAIDKALSSVADDLKGKYDVTDDATFNSAVTSFKTNVISSIDNFLSDDYTGSYTSQIAAENAFTSMFASLKNK